MLRSLSRTNYCFSPETKRKPVVVGLEIFFFFPFPFILLCYFVCVCVCLCVCVRAPEHLFLGSGNLTSSSSSSGMRLVTRSICQNYDFSLDYFQLRRNSRCFPSFIDVVLHSWSSKLHPFAILLATYKREQSRVSADGRCNGFNDLHFLF